MFNALHPSTACCSKSLSSPCPGASSPFCRQITNSSRVHAPVSNLANRHVQSKFQHVQPNVTQQVLPRSQHWLQARLPSLWYTCMCNSQEPHLTTHCLLCRQALKSSRHNHQDHTQEGSACSIARQDLHLLLIPLHRSCC